MNLKINKKVTYLHSYTAYCGFSMYFKAQIYFNYKGYAVVSLFAKNSPWFSDRCLA